MEILKDLSKGPVELINGSYAPLFFEPIAGSGERLTIAIIAFSDENEGVCIVKTINDKKINCILGDGGVMVFNNLFDFATIGLKEIVNSETLMKWSPALSGFTLGNLSRTSAIDMVGIVNQGIMRYSALGTTIESL